MTKNHCSTGTNDRFMNL